VSKTKETIIIRVEDQGSGFDVDTIKNSDAYGFGLHNLSERMENYGGTVELDSKPGKGTKILLTAPISSRKEKFI
ncbi:MAG: hypothetical protein K8S18_20060, partial [Desulfobacula sp.]|nr:hypothetical protein [Desulfobacula sp.]